MGPLPRTHGMLGAMLADARAVPDRRHPRRPAVQGLVAAPAPGHALVPGRPDRRARRVIGAFYLTEKRGRRRFDDDDRGADRAARRARRDRDHERAAVRAQPRAVDPVGAQPAGAGAARRRQPEAVQPDLDGRGGGDAARARPGRGARRSSQRVRELAREALDELRVADPRPAPARARARRARRRAAQGGRDAAPRPRRRDRARGRPASRARSAGDRELAVLRIAHEALHNAVRHAAAEHVTVRCRRQRRRAASRSPTTGSASIPTSRSCAPGTSA